MYCRKSVEEFFRNFMANVRASSCYNGIMVIFNFWCFFYGGGGGGGGGSCIAPAAK